MRAIRRYILNTFDSSGTYSLLDIGGYSDKNGINTDTDESLMPSIDLEVLVLIAYCNYLLL